jgi:hypothetical protein
MPPQPLPLGPQLINKRFPFHKLHYAIPP